MSIESLHTLAKVVEPRRGPAAFRCRPIKSMGIEARVTSVKVAAAAEHGIKSRTAAHDECLERRFASFLRLLNQPAIELPQLPPCIIRRQSPSISRPAE